MRWLLVLSLLIISTPAFSNPVDVLAQEYEKLEYLKSQHYTIIPDGPLLKVGVTHPHVALVIRRINEVYNTSLPETTIYDSTLEGYVKRAQRDRSLNDDGVVGRQTRESFNTGPEKAQKAIQQSINEWNARVGYLSSPRFIVVNIPSYELIAYEYGEEVFRSKVIVGSVRNKTPLMATEAFSLKFNPDWTAPPGIRQSYAAKWNTGERNYFKKNGVRVSYDKNGQLRFYQPPSTSYLGKLKVELDNPYNVYLHDTNSPRLFAKSKRALSHGCIRVQDYVKLAAWLANTDKNDIQTKINKGRTFWESINRIPVYTVYMTAYPNNNGTIGYFSDVYRKLQ